MADLVERTQREITARVGELKPVVEEYERLQAASLALGALDGSPTSLGTSAAALKASTRKPRRRARSRSRTLSAAPAPAERAPAPKTSVRRPGPRRTAANGLSPRGSQALRIISEHPGIKIAELTKRMGINRTSLYKVLPAVELAGKVRRDGSHWYPAGS